MVDEELRRLADRRAELCRVCRFSYAVVQQSQGTPNPQIRKYAGRFSTNFKLRGITQNETLRKFEIGGALRYQDAGFLGYYGKQQFPATITDLDRTRPIWDTGKFFGKTTSAGYAVDLNLRYRTRLWANRSTPATNSTSAIFRNPATACRRSAPSRMAPHTATASSIRDSLC